MNFSPSSSIKQRMQSETLYQCSSSDEDELDNETEEKSLNIATSLIYCSVLSLAISKYSS